jgi:hypothetical protein
MPPTTRVDGRLRRLDAVRHDVGLDPEALHVLADRVRDRDHAVDAAQAEGRDLLPPRGATRDREMQRGHARPTPEPRADERRGRVAGVGHVHVHEARRQRPQLAREREERARLRVARQPRDDAHARPRVGEERMQLARRAVVDDGDELDLLAQLGDQRRGVDLRSGDLLGVEDEHDRFPRVHGWRCYGR